jgi:predicted N-formylglutamate amidohydrolase
MARSLRAPLVAGTTTRLLVDLNRSPHNARVFSEYTRSLPRAARDDLLQRWHAPHWGRVERAIAAQNARGRRVLHIGVHTFTPVLDGVVRNTAIGLLYDPARRAERSLCAAWAEELRGAPAAGRVRFNYPYRGTSDGIITAMRRRVSPRLYVGIELEVNHGLLVPSTGRFPPDLPRSLIFTLKRAISSFPA